MTQQELIDWIKKQEGFSSTIYIDSMGKRTIGYGRNIDDAGITKEEAEYLLIKDLERSWKHLLNCHWFIGLPENVACALVNMCFNLGFRRFLTFRKMILALIERDFTKAAKEALESKWAREVGDRAKDIALMIREG